MHLHVKPVTIRQSDLFCNLKNGAMAVALRALLIKFVTICSPFRPVFPNRLASIYCLHHENGH